MWTGLSSPEYKYIYTSTIYGKLLPNAKYISGNLFFHRGLMQRHSVEIDQN